MHKLYIVFLCSVVISCSPLPFERRSKQDSINVKQVDMLSFKMIKTGKNTVIGYLEETENIITNARNPGVKEIRKLYYVYDIDFTKIGFITEHGIVSVYKYTAEGKAVQIAQNEVFTIEAGMKKVLSYDGAVYYDDFEPAPPWRERD